MLRLIGCWGLLLLIVWSCTEGTPEDTPPDAPSTFHTRPYYFPIEALEDGMVYEYRRLEGPNSYLSHFWHLKSHVASSGDTFLIWKRYNPLFEQDQYIREWIVRDGVITKDYYFYIYDSTSQQRKTYPNQVEQNVVFPFDAALDSNLIYRFSTTMTLPPDFVRVKLVRDRRFGEAFDQIYEGDTLPAIAFYSKDFYDLEDTLQGGFWNEQRAVVEVYAQGVGLLQEQVWMPGVEQPEVTQLAGRYTWAAFDSLRQATQNNAQ